MKSESLCDSLNSLEDNLRSIMVQIKKLSTLMLQVDIAPETIKSLQSQIGLPIHNFLTEDDGILELYSLAFDTEEAELGYNNDLYDDTIYDEPEDTLSTEATYLDDMMDTDFRTVDSYGEDDSYEDDDSYEEDGSYGEDDSYEDEDMYGDTPSEHEELNQLRSPAQIKYDDMFGGFQSLQKAEDVSFKLDSFNNPNEAELYEPLASAELQNTPTNPVSPGKATLLEQDAEVATKAMLGWQSLVEGSKQFDIQGSADGRLA